MMFDAGSFLAVNVPPLRPRVAPAARANDALSGNAAPIVAPSGVSDETGRERDPVSRLDGAIDFTPALLNGQAVPVVMTVTVNVELR